jgi:hypothetical protein
MGLDTSHDCWHGAYSAFARWRNELAVAAGYPMDADDRYYELPWDEFKDENYQGDWNGKVPGDDPLLYLLVHSDCDGVIHPEQGKDIAVRLRELLPKLDEEKSGGHIASMHATTQQFIDGLEAAATAGEDVRFH